MKKQFVVKPLARPFAITFYNIKNEKFVDFG